MKLRSCLFLAAISCAVLALPAWTARRPRYGGILRVEISASLNVLNPSTAVNPAITVNRGADSAENQLLTLFDPRSTAGNLVSNHAQGPFRVAEWEAGKHAKLVANNEYSGGRPFLDEIEVQLGRSSKDRLIDLELGKTDLTELAAEDARRSVDSGVRISASLPDELIAIVFVSGHPLVEDARVRQSLAFAIDRPTIASFILQKEGEPAGGLLPQWSSGTAFLFPVAANPTAAKEQWSQIRGSPKISVGYDAGDGLEQSIVERIAVNARETGIAVASMAVTPWPAASSQVDARIVRLRMSSPKPREALTDFLSTLSSIAGVKFDLPPDGAAPQAIYECEQAVVSSSRVIPLVWLPQVYGLSSRVRDWNAPGPGEGWPLADVWLDDSASPPSLK